MNHKTFQVLEFDKVLRQLATYTNFSAGEEAALRLQPTIHVEEARRWQAETREAYNLLNSGSDVTIGGSKDVRPAVGRAERGYTLLAEDFLNIRNTLSAARDLRRKIEKVGERYPNLLAIALLVEECPGLVATISATIDDRGEVLDTASVRLGSLRRDLRVAYGRLQEKLRSIINSYGVYLQEPIISLRNGRYVIPVRAESRGNIKGIVHDQSGSGATFWMEPLGTVDLNNEYRTLQIEEEKEIQRILAELSHKVAEQGEIIIRIVERMAEFDLIFAKAVYAGELNAIEPEFVPWHPQKPHNLHPGSTIWIKKARHPLLNQDTVIPTDLTLPDEVFLVLITGPNTGGKTVSLKTMGLMVLMAQSGLHIPANEAKISLFDRVFADIGDEQSIEQSLSTFSAHMTNIIRILNETDERTLILFDELGSGTDPAEGAAIAQAITEYLRDKGSTTFIATHYPELKAYATQTQGATNASLLFDVETLSPTYEMTIGIPGKSNALAIAKRLGLDSTILDQAMKILGTGSSETTQLLDSIYDMREKMASEEASVRLLRKKIERERQQLLDQLANIDPERQRVLAEARAQADKELEALRAEIRQVRQSLRSAQSQNTLKQLGKNVEAIAEKQREALEAQPLLAEPEVKRVRRLQVGDTVRVKSLNTKGEVVSLNGDEAEVALGQLRLKIRVDELEFKSRPVVEESGVSTSIAPSPGIELDIRGKRVEESLEELEKYLDSAVLARLPWVRIIHGKGTGRLREAIRQALSQHKAVLSWEEGQEGEGGAGVTVARLEELK